MSHYTQVTDLMGCGRFSLILIFLLLKQQNVLGFNRWLCLICHLVLIIY